MIKIMIMIILFISGRGLLWHRLLRCSVPINDNDNNDLVIMIMIKSCTSQAGASYGTGYCDAQCPADLKFINGEANCMDWTGSSGLSL